MVPACVPQADRPAISGSADSTRRGRFAVDDEKGRPLRRPLRVIRSLQRFGAERRATRELDARDSSMRMRELRVLAMMSPILRMYAPPGSTPTASAPFRWSRSRTLDPLGSQASGDEGSAPPRLSVAGPFRSQRAAARGMRIWMRR